MVLERTYVPAAGDVISQAGWNAELNNVVERIGALMGGDIHPRAGITRRQVADRYSIVCIHTMLVPRISWNGDVAINDATAGNGWKIPLNGTIHQQDLCPVVLPTGTTAWLMAVLSKIRTLESGTGPSYPELRIYKNTDVLGGGAQIHAVQNQWYSLMAADPSANPVVDIQNGDYLYAGVDNSTSATDTRVRGWDLFTYLKVEHLPG